jgi:hypothetical protein
MIYLIAFICFVLFTSSLFFLITRMVLDIAGSIGDLLEEHEHILSNSSLNTALHPHCLGHAGSGSSRNRELSDERPFLPKQPSVGGDLATAAQGLEQSKASVRHARDQPHLAHAQERRALAEPPSPLQPIDRNL